MGWKETVQAASNRENRQAYREAWGLIYDECARRMHTKAETMIGPRRGFDSQGIVQDVFLKASQSLSQLTLTEGREREGLVAWMLKITHNHTLDLLKRADAYKIVAETPPLVLLDEIEVSARENLIDYDAIERTVADPEAMIYVRQLLNALSDEDRLLFFHRCIDKMEFTDLAALLTETYGTQCTAVGLRTRFAKLLPALVAFAELGPAAIKATRGRRGQKEEHEVS